ncbi:MAG: cytochrome c biogenesis protein CcsA, partial [Spirochaetia bacterium]|nr:cytochrome c biogenesis protein CcsA [Spirochaetia bacterium]
EGDTLRVLVAVLDSNFWLSTHVIAINLGYAGVVFSGVVGHVYFVLALRKGTDPERLKEVFKLTYGVQAFGLLFSFTGTMLGGVWADQSWGRFWGWDPKENGALLIVLWGAILFHARFAGWIRDIGFAAGSVIGIMVVMMAWFGINLLGVGLHSYGFTEGLWTGLVSYLIAQSLFVIFSLYFIYLRNHPRPANKTG